MRQNEGTTSLRRVRFMGALALIGAFGLGCAGTWWVLRDRNAGVRLMITATDEVPGELRQLSLNTEQRAQVQTAIRHGRDRVLRVVDAFDPAMKMAMDSTDKEIRLILTDAQRAKLDSARAKTGQTIVRQRVFKP